jgi:hypothetical protein
MLNRVQPEMVNFGSEQGQSISEPGGIVALFVLETRCFAPGPDEQQEGLNPPRGKTRGMFCL